MLIKGKKITFSEEDNNEKQRDALRSQIGILPELAALTFPDGVHLNHLILVLTKLFQMHCISESKMNKIIKKKVKSIIKRKHYNANNIAKAYTKVFIRIDSSTLTTVILSVNSGLHLLSFLHNDDICLQDVLGSNVIYFLNEYELFANLFYKTNYVP